MLTMILFLVVTIFYPYTCSLKTKPQKNMRTSIVFIDTTDTDKKSSHYHTFLTATYQHKSGKLGQAMQSYKKFFSQTHALYPYGDYFELLSSIGQTSALLKLYESKKEALDKTLTDNIKAQLTLAQSYLQHNEDEKAEAIYLSLSEKNPDNPQIAYFTAVAMSKKGPQPEALAWIDKSLSNRSLNRIHHLFHFIKSKMYLEAGKHQEALAEIEKSLSINPKFDKALLLKALMFEQQGKADDAIKGYQHFLDVVGPDSSVEKQLIQLLFQQKQFGSALKYVKKIKTQSPDHYFNVALIEFRSGHYEHALQFIDEAIKKDSSFNKARLLKAEILLNLNKFDQLLEFMTQWISQNPDKPDAIHTLLLLRKTPISGKKIFDVLKAVEKKQPSLLVLAALADLLTEQKNYALSVQYYDKIINQTQDLEIKSKALFQIGYIHFITNQTQKLEETLSRAIKQKSVYPSSYNLLAYHYAKTGKKLPLALQLIDKALKQIPDSPYYLDTKGYVLLKQGKTEEAITIFKQALKLAPNDQVIQKHLKRAEEKQS